MHKGGAYPAELATAAVSREASRHMQLLRQWALPAGPAGGGDAQAAAGATAAHVWCMNGTRKCSWLLLQCELKHCEDPASGAAAFIVTSQLHEGRGPDTGSRPLRVGKQQQQQQQQQQYLPTDS
jgi:hypothetical protein